MFTANVHGNVFTFTNCNEFRKNLAALVSVDAIDFDDAALTWDAFTAGHTTVYIDGDTVLEVVSHN